MTEAKFWSFLGIALAVVAFCPESYSGEALVIIGMVALLICYVISYIWNKITTSHHKWVDGLFYFFSKTELPYIVIDKIVKYHVISEKNAKYSLNCKLKCKKESESFCYKGRYHRDQDEDIHVSVTNKKECSYNYSEDLKWSNVDIFPNDRIVHKNDLWNCGFSLENLHISRLSKHSYISCKVTEKVKHLKLIAKVSASLNPAEKATFIVQDIFGREISQEPILLNAKGSVYEKTVFCPRKGRKYIIKWGYN